MSSLDDELQKAVLDSEAEEAARPVVVPEAAAPGPKPGKELGLLIGLLVMAAAILALVFFSFDDAAIYSKTVEEVVRSRGALAGRSLRVQGTLVKGSLGRRDSPCEYRFRLKKNASVIDVRYPQCVVPDTFRDVPDMDVDVTATGKLAPEGHLVASEIMAKCPSKYDMKQKAASGEKAPHSFGAGPPLAPTAPGY